jgi:hypothetical protein
MNCVHLYIDDSGTRQTDHEPQLKRGDGLDYFALGGVLIHEQNIGHLIKAHRALLEKWNIEGPLHSTKIRGQRGPFAWLGTDEAKKHDFLSELESMILRLPVVGLACVVDRPGYVARYADRYEQPWLLCKTAFAILVERAAKYASRCGAKLEIYFEQAGELEDRAILSYAKLLETEGMPFDPGTSGSYNGLKPDDFKSILLGQPNRITKMVPMIQIADLMLFPMVKGGYDSKYRPYAKMMESKRIMDAVLKVEDRPHLGIKYSCFDRKNEGPA